MDSHVKVIIIAAIAENGVIGNKNELPWKLREDLARFKQLTDGHTVIVGRKTHESIIARLGTPLPNRKTIVVTKSDTTWPEVKTAKSFDEAVQSCADQETVYIIGGAALYEAALTRADEMVLTRVSAKPEGDVFFPVWNEDDWEKVQTDFQLADDKNQFACLFETWKRKAKP